MIVDEKNLTNKYAGKIRFGQQTIQPRKINTYTEWPEHRSEPIRPYLPELQFFDILIEMIVSGKTKTEAELLMSNIINDFANGNVIQMDDMDMSVSAEITGIEKEFIKRWDYKIIITMQGWDKSMSQVIVTMDSTVQSVTVSGNQSTPCIVEVTALADLASVELTGMAYNQISGEKESIIIKNLKAGKKVVVNGEDCTVLQDGVNKFADTEMWEFPVLKPGKNMVSCSSDKCTVSLKYKPRYV
ncbi:MAG: hypothetical protein Q4Q33_08740 [Eubacteriales bacterium]|nr:hypothetical protein [Eubacteriales bacterium]